MTLGGYICVRNGEEGDYCWREAAASLLPVVDELILCDSDSTDGTREAMDRMADKEKKIRVINYPWPAPKGDDKWWTTWLNFARSQLKTDYQITLDADEILSDQPDCHLAIREAIAAGNNESRTFNRLNFWKDAAHLIPEGHAIGKWVTRFGRTEWWMPSDEGHSSGELPILDEAQKDPRLEIFHLGFLRRKDAFWRKARVVLGAFFGSYDTRLEALEKEDKPLSEVQDCEWTPNIVPWKGYMPDGAQRWLSERGHNTNHYLAMNEREAYAKIRINTEPVPDGQPMKILVVGDLGDVIYGMPLFKAIGSTHLIAKDAPHICKRLIQRMHLIGPLLLSQPYVKGFTEHQEEEVHWNEGDFRSNYRRTQSLAWTHMVHYTGQQHLPPIDVDLRLPWITGIKPDPRSRNAIVINRTSRYHNKYFPWREIVEHYGNAIIFVGTHEEHATFCRDFGSTLYIETANLLEVAQLIAASALFIGNQSACFAIAEGMKARRLLEVDTHQPDTIVTKDTPLRYLCADGGIDLPALGNHAPLHVKPRLNNVNYDLNPSSQPRSGWSIAPPFSRAPHKDVSYGNLKRRLMREEPLSDEAAHRAIFDALAHREPSYFFTGKPAPELMMFRQACANAV